MAHRLTTGPTTAVLSAEDAMAHCRIDEKAEGVYLDSLIARATRHCENICKRAFITQTWTLTMDGWCDCRYVTDGIIYVPRPPLISLSGSGLGITYLDSDGASQTLAADQYRVDAQSQPGRIERAYGVSWPTTRGVIGDVTIVHTCGYGAAASVPEDIKHAILLLVEHWYDPGRGAVLVGSISKEIEFGVMSLLDPYIMEAYA